MSDSSSDSVGNDTSSSASNSASQANTDSLSTAATEAISGVAQQALDSIADMVSGAIGSMADALGLDQAFDQAADALGLDLDIKDVVTAAVMGMMTGGLPGAVMGVANALTGGSLLGAAHDMVEKNVPAEFQGLANLAIDAMASRIPGAAGSMNLNNPLSAIAGGALTNGRVPSVDQFTNLARTANEFLDVARGVMDAATRGDWADAVDAAASLDTDLRENLDIARSVAAQVGVDLGAGRAPVAQGGHGPLGDAAERVAVATAELMLRR